MIEISLREPQTRHAPMRRSMNKYKGYSAWFSLITEPHYLILEYVMYGKLLAYLRDHRTRQYFYNFSEDSAALTSRDLTVFGYCVARGMEYLASKKVRKYFHTYSPLKINLDADSNFIDPLSSLWRNKKKRTKQRSNQISTLTLVRTAIISTFYVDKRKKTFIPRRLARGINLLLPFPIFLPWDVRNSNASLRKKKNPRRNESGWISMRRF